MKVRRGIGITAVLALAVPGLVAITPVTAHAVPQICKPGEKFAKVNRITVSNAPTHMEGISLAPGVGFNRQVALRKDRTFSAGIDTTAEASAKAGVILAKASATLNVKLAVAGSWTTSKSVTDTWTIASSSKHRRYILWSGTRVYGGRYSYNLCIDGGRKWSVTPGKWRSFRTQWQGSSLCGAGYKKGTMEYNAAILGGC
ncbi:hypothetical protein E1263_32575 [Kribbella antibiotica]|uniref:Uncharacterized protein n=1 Tax=Kribbella antibiotica TaxID=190195 RepID=A0A4R4YWZ9_9ACTN|nr:hypothetical protein [Kribbella antibiotica]TDD49084.1 hypothetical protein E1263_32575 [Kribbella antibiotica]